MVVVYSSYSQHTGDHTLYSTTTATHMLYKVVKVTHTNDGELCIMMIMDYDKGWTMTVVYKYGGMGMD